MTARHMQLLTTEAEPPEVHPLWKSEWILVCIMDTTDTAVLCIVCKKIYIGKHYCSSSTVNRNN